MTWQCTKGSHHAARPARLLAQSCAYAAIAMLLCTDRAATQYVPYFPTPQPLVERMLEMAEVKESDFLIDLGCGDGRIPVTAAQRYGATGLGVDFEAPGHNMVSAATSDRRCRLAHLNSVRLDASAFGRGLVPIEQPAVLCSANSPE